MHDIRIDCAVYAAASAIVEAPVMLYAHIVPARRMPSSETGLRSQVVRGPHGSYWSGGPAPDHPMGAKTTRGLKINRLMKMRE